MRHALAQFHALLRIGRADNRADGGIAALAARLLAPFFHQIGDRLIQRPPVLKAQILKLAGGRVARLDQHEHARSVLAACVGKRLDAVHAEVRVDRRDVRAEGRLRAVRHIRLADVGVGVARGRRADVVALHVRHHDQPLLLRVADGLFIDLHARRAVHFIIRHLHLDRRNDVAKRVDQAHVVGVNGLRRVLKGMNARRQHVPNEALRQIFDAGIQPRDGRVLEFGDPLSQSFHDIHSCHLSWGFAPNPTKGLSFSAVCFRHWRQLPKTSLETFGSQRLTSFFIDRYAVNVTEGAGNSVPCWGVGQSPTRSLYA